MIVKKSSFTIRSLG